MAWTMNFVPEKPGSNIGQIVLTESAGTPDEFVFSGSVNLEFPDSVRKMMSVAKDAQAAAMAGKQLSAKYQQVLDELTVEMNK